jgi:hypothetical protein
MQTSVTQSGVAGNALIENGDSRTTGSSQIPPPISPALQQLSSGVYYSGGEDCSSLGKTTTVVAISDVCD